MQSRHAVCGFAPLLLMASLSTPAATFTVTRADDPLMATCTPLDCSLRAAVAASAITPAADLILLPEGVYTVARSALTVSGGLTIRGVGPTLTSIVGTSEDVKIFGGALVDLTIEGLRFTTGAEEAIGVDDGRLVLRDVDMPNAANVVIVRQGALTASLTVQGSTLGTAGCIGIAPLCTFVDSRVTSLAMIGEQIELDVRRVQFAGDGSSAGIYFNSNGRARIADATFSNHSRPIEVNAPDVDVLVERSLFIGNVGPMRGSGSGTIRLDDVEFRDNIVSNSNSGLPAVLSATDGVAWRINRALFDGNRGGASAVSIGAVIAADNGANVVITNSTFVDNTYRSGASPINSHAIGVRTTTADPTIMWLFHVTMRRPTTVPATTLGSLLAVSGTGGSVRLFNTALDGTCKFLSGGSVLQAVGSIESIGNSCGIAGAGNLVNVPAAQLGLGTLADHGGYTHTFLPAAGSVLVGAASPTWCPFTFGIDQRRYVRPAGWIGCDVGAVEAGSISDVLFADGFE